LAARLAAEPQTRGPSWCKAIIRTAVRLRNALSTLPVLVDALKSMSGASTLLEDARDSLSHAKFPALLEELNRVLDADGYRGPSGQGSAGHTALMYAVRPNVSALLDIARQTWNDALEQIHNLHRTYAVKYMELNIKLEYTDRRGWHLTHTASQVAPEEFLRTEKKGSSGRQTSTTRDLNSENFKLRQAEREILSQTVVVLGGLYEVLRGGAHLLYKVSHAASTLDLIQAFVGYTLLQGDYARPQLTDEPSAPIAIKAGRHPLLDRVLSQDAATDKFEPLDFFVGETCHFQAVTGANGGGKSTYLQTLALLVILAQIGCFIPAQYAAIRIVSAIYTRIGTSDNLEASASTFLVEMQEAAHILDDVTPESLVLIDELGRGTAHADGISICWAVCERLVEMQVYTLFATHFYEVCRLQAVFPGFRNMHLQSVEAEAFGAEGKRRKQTQHFTVHQATSLESLLAKPQARYGLRAAEHVGLPAALLVRAREMATLVEQRLKLNLPGGRPGECDSQRRDASSLHDGSGGAPGAGDDEHDANLETARKLVALARSSTLAPEALANVLASMQRPWLERRRDDD